MTDNSKEQEQELLDFAASADGKQFNKVILVGEPDWVARSIHSLHALGFADSALWTPLLPTKNPGEVDLLHESISHS
ncbi:hypothetical protein H6F67_15285 [Microcoleus sp. FACHB-1515]|uniref:hypothetical protein n=1 Tax=Cyanophyceae TaxID=3028117 RepID=UPI0016850982|nr:hypothetical protein [Microcoleus sp. FACHB-1515]MBD2091217.1 hypothetical protein [Microcoleus sp. FACHB-1515]